MGFINRQYNSQLKEYSMDALIPVGECIIVGLMLLSVYLVEAHEIKAYRKKVPIAVRRFLRNSNRIVK